MLGFSVTHMIHTWKPFASIPVKDIHQAVILEVHHGTGVTVSIFRYSPSLFGRARPSPNSHRRPPPPTWPTPTRGYKYTHALSLLVPLSLSLSRYSRLSYTLKPFAGRELSVYGWKVLFLFFSFIQWREQLKKNKKRKTKQNMWSMLL